MMLLRAIFEEEDKAMSNEPYQGNFFEHFTGLGDTRQEGKVMHPLIDILFIVTAGVICGFDEWDAIYMWARAPSSQTWLKKHITLPYGMPSLSTLRRVFAILNPKEFSSYFIAWMKAACQLPAKDVISVDGKTSKGSRDKGKGQKGIHMVSAICHSHGLVIGQTKTDEKSNEITAIPELLDQLFIEGCIVTIDAIGAQKKIVKKIVIENKADYVINLKGNQGILKGEVEDYFEHLEESGALENIKKQVQSNNPEETTSDLAVLQTLEKGHGRIEKRTYYYSTEIDWMIDAKRDWEKLMGIGKVVREVEHIAEPAKKTSETAYYIGSVDNITDFATAARCHWGIESMHWSLDVAFGDDRNQTRQVVAAQNLAIVKRLVFNALKNETKVQPKMSKPNKRIQALMDPEYRDILIDLSFR